MYHYTYIISNNTELIEHGKYYIGIRSCDCDPNIDNEYYGSSVYLTKDILLKNKSNFTKNIIKVFNTRKEAMLHEIELHQYFNVEQNNIFYNKHNARTIGFSWAGRTHSDKTKQKIKLKRKQQIVTEEQIEKFKHTWKTKTTKEQEKYKDFRKQLWHGKPNNEKEAFRKKMSDIGLAHWQNISEEEVRHRVNKILQVKSNRSEKQKREEFKNRSVAQKISKNNRSTVEIRSFVDKRKQTYNNMSQDRRDEISKKQSTQMKGRKWYNNGIISKMFFDNDVPTEFTRGRKI